MNWTVNSTAEPPFAFTLNASNIIAAILVALLIILNLVGNIMVIVCFYNFSHLRTKCNYFIISLCVADICVALFAMPIWLVLQLTEYMERDLLKVLSQEVYKFWTMMDILVGTASIANLAAVSVDRTLAISAPFRYQSLLTHKRVIIVIIATWIYALVITSGRASESKNFLRNLYIPLVIVFGCFLPLLIMMIMYLRIYLVARSQAVKLGNYSRDIKAAKTIAIVIGSFMACWLPFFLYTFSVFIFICVKDKTYRPELIPAMKAVKWMEYLNSCLNPIVYTCLNRPYRSAFQRMFRKCFQDDFERNERSTSQYISEYQRPLNTEETEVKDKKESTNNSGAAFRKKNSQVMLMNGAKANDNNV